MARKETWQMLMEGSSFIAEEITKNWHDIHKDKNYPGTFRQSEGCQIPKGNNKQRCKAVRVINKLCPAGKQDFSFGFTKGSRREQAIFIANTTTWKLRKQGLSYTQSMHDVANAFPSMSHNTLDGMLEK